MIHEKLLMVLSSNNWYSRLVPILTPRQFFQGQCLSSSNVPRSHALTYAHSPTRTHACIHSQALAHITTDAHVHTLTPLSPSLRPQDFQLQRDHSCSHSVEVNFNRAFHFDFRKPRLYLHVDPLSLSFIHEILDPDCD